VEQGALLLLALSSMGGTDLKHKEIIYMKGWSHTANNWTQIQTKDSEDFGTHVLNHNKCHVHIDLEEQ
jgi:hypothetical protein